MALVQSFGKRLHALAAVALVQSGGKRLHALAAVAMALVQSFGKRLQKSLLQAEMTRSPIDWSALRYI